MKTTTFKSLVDGKINELKSVIAETKTDGKITKNTRGTKLYKLGRDRRVLCLIRTLLETCDESKLSDADKDTLTLLTTLENERTVYKVEVHEGDSIMDLLQKYQDVKDIMSKITKACEREGLKQDFATGTIVKA